MTTKLCFWYYPYVALPRSLNGTTIKYCPTKDHFITIISRVALMSVVQSFIGVYARLSVIGLLLQLQYVFTLPLVFNDFKYRHGVHYGRSVGVEWF